MSYPQMPSSEFRLKYASLDHPVDVTVNGRILGRWTPAVTTVPAGEPLRGPGADAAYRKLAAKK